MLVVNFLIGLVIWSGILFSPALAVYALIKWRGRWRVAAALPLVALLAFFAPMIPAWIRDPTQNNLWGLILMPLAMLLAIYSGVVLILYRRRARKEPL